MTDFSRVEKFIFQKMSESRLPSVTAALVQKNDLVWSTALGFRDLENAMPANPDSLYGIGSVTKSFTALAILQLAEAGKLSLDDPVERFLPLPLRPFGEPVRIRHFLSHTSGFPALAMSESTSANKVGAGDHWLPVSSYDDLLTFIQDAQDWAVTRPGERWFYMNEGYILLGKIIEMCSGQRWFEYVADHILQPLGMQRTCFYADQLAAAENTAIPYEITAEGKRIPATYAFSDINCKGGLISSVTELAKYVSMFLAQGKSLENANTIISPASYAEMTTPRVNTPPKEGYFGDSFYGYGLGINHTFLGRTLIGHGGSVRVSTAYIGFLPEEGLGTAVLANGSGYSPQFIAMYLLASALGEDPDDLPFVKNENLLKGLSGNYKSYQGTMRAHVRKAGDMLMLTLEDKHAPATLPLLPYQLDSDPLVFYTLSGGAKLYVEFYRKPEHTTLIYERYALRKY